MRLDVGRRVDEELFDRAENTDAVQPAGRRPLRPDRHVVADRVAVAFDQVPRIVDHRAAHLPEHVAVPVEVQRAGHDVGADVQVRRVGDDPGNAITHDADAGRLKLREQLDRRQPAGVDKHDVAPAL